MGKDIKLSELFEQLTRGKSIMYNVNSLGSSEVKSLFEECSSNKFNMFIIKSSGDIVLHSNISDPSKIDAYDENVVSYSQCFMMDDFTKGESNRDKVIERILQTIKTAFTNKEKGFCVK